MQPTVEDQIRYRKMLELRNNAGAIQGGSTYVDEPIPEDLTLQRAKQLRQQPDVTHPSQLAQSPYLQAAQLTEQANQPKPDPFQGASGWKRTLAQGMLGAAEGSIHAQDPGGYQGYLDRQKVFDYRQQQDMLTRAKELRGEGRQQSVDYANSQNADLTRERQQSIDDLNRMNILSEIKQREAPKPPLEVSPDASLMTPEGKVLGTAPSKPGTAATDKNIGNYTNKAGKHVEIFQKPDGSTYEKPFDYVQPTGGGADSVVAVDTVDDKGNKIRKFVSKKAGDTYPAAPTAQEENRRDQADIINNYADHVIALIDAHPESVGPIAGRIARGETIAGTVDPNAKQIGTALASMVALQPVLHGFRGGSQTVEHFNLALGDQALNPAALKASIREIQQLARDIRKGGTNAASPPETRVVNGVTYERVGNEWHKK